MATQGNQDPISARLRRGIVLSVQEDACEIFPQNQRCSVRFATPFPSPRTERVAPSHLVALATAADDTERVVWPWFDAVILGEEADLLRCGSRRTAKSRRDPAGRISRASQGPGRIYPLGCPTPTGGSPVQRPPEPRTPTSSSTRSRGSVQNTIFGTISNEETVAV
jgi:hypothetical protein